MLLEVRNDGISPANNVVVVDALPRYMKYLSSSENGIYRPENHEVFWIFDTLPAKSVRNVFITTQLPWGVPNGVALNHRGSYRNSGYGTGYVS